MTDEIDDRETDPRPRYRDALAWVRALTAHVPTARLTDPTPCPEWDVRGLLGHLVATVDRARVIGEGGDPTTMPFLVTGVDDGGWVDALATAEEKAAAAWTDDARLDVQVVAPWGRVPGRVALWAYVGEALVHGWDLAVATGQDVEADADLASTVLAHVRGILPAEVRGGPVPFATPVTPRADAGPTEQLANWAGHAR